MEIRLTTLLYITAHPHDKSTSYSMAVGDAFIESYKAAHPNDQVVHIDLYNETIPHIDAEVFAGWGKLQSGGSFDTLSSGEQSKVGRLNEIVTQFAEADKYVFVTPLWNFLFPPIMKNYIDAICVAGKTFKYTSNGPQGLLGGKKALHIQARGGVYSEGPAAGLEMGHRYIGVIMGFLGVQDFNGIFVEGQNQFPDRAQEIKEQAIQKAKETAKDF